MKKSRFFAESWSVAFRETSIGQILEDKKQEFTVIKNNLRFWAADPFIFEYNHEIYIFAELYDYIKNRGTLGYCKIKNGKATRWKQVICESFHLSYPFIFEIGNDIFIMPEAGTTQELFCYKAISFPDRWEKQQPFREGVVFGDVTPFIENGKPYALAYLIENSMDYKLYMLNLFERNRDHPIESENVLKARPAGKMFYLGNRKIRPAQNCVEGYGKGLVFYEYNFENERYIEKEIANLYAEDLQLSKKLFLDGIHTYNGNKQIEVIDIKTRRFNFVNFIFRIILKVFKRRKR